MTEWGIYEVKLMFVIIRYDGMDTEVYTARDIAQKWVKKNNSQTHKEDSYTKQINKQTNKKHRYCKFNSEKGPRGELELTFRDVFV